MTTQKYYQKMFYIIDIYSGNTKMLFTNMFYTPEVYNSCTGISHMFLEFVMRCHGMEKCLWAKWDLSSNLHLHNI